MKIMRINIIDRSRGEGGYIRWWKEAIQVPHDMKDIWVWY